MLDQLEKTFMTGKVRMQALTVDKSFDKNLANLTFVRCDIDPFRDFSAMLKSGQVGL